jgi:hypothetical protein
MKRTFALILAALVAAALFGGLVHAVLVAAHLSEPAATTVYGLTPRRLWATSVAVLALVSVVIGGLRQSHSGQNTPETVPHLRWAPSAPPGQASRPGASSAAVQPAVAEMQQRDSQR